jgi:hypothetical protein
MHPTITFKDIETKPKGKGRTETETVTIDGKRLFISGDIAEKANLKQGDKVKMQQVLEHDRETNSFAIIKSCTGHTLYKANDNYERLVLHNAEKCRFIKDHTGTTKFRATVFEGNIIFEPINESPSIEKTEKGGDENVETAIRFEFGKGNSFGKSRA